MEKILEKHNQKIKFIVVGGINTLIDFILLFFFTGIGMNKLIANYFSTGIALLFSFIANKKFTFKSTTGDAKRQFVLFLGVTIVGLWVLQPLVLWISTSALEDYISNESINLFIAKVIATCVSLVWNYLLYSRLVFKNESETK